MAKKAIIVENLIKNYGAVKAVQSISFDVDEGSLFSFLGVNGAGKSTTINIICSLLRKNSGRVSVCGYNLDTEADKIKAAVGVVFQHSVLDDLLTVRDNLTVRASYYKLTGAEWRKRLDELTDLLSLDDILQRQYKKLSGGQKRRVDIARGLLNFPKLLILDEPTTGLDPKTRKNVWEIVARLQKERGMTVFLTTHYMEEAEGADKVVIIDDGRIAAEGTPAELKNKYSKTSLYIYGDETVSSSLTAQNVSFEKISGGARIPADNPEQLLDLIKYKNIPLKDFEVIKGNMDDVFLSVTGKKSERSGL